MHKFRVTCDAIKFEVEGQVYSS